MPALAQADPPDILVTASRTGTTDIADTPIAMTAIGRTALEAGGIGDLRDLAEPGMVVTQTGPFAQIYLRGIGSGNVFGGSDPSVAMQIDGVYLARPAAYLADFLDIERVEILRGPQSTLYGRNTIGGTVSLTSRAPGAEPEAAIRAGLGNYAMRQIAGRVSGPLAQGIAASLAVQGRWHGAYLDNIVPGVGDIDSERSFGARGQVRADLRPGWSATLRLDHARADDSEAGNSKTLQLTADPLANAILGDLRKVAVSLRTSSIRRSSGAALDNEVDLGATQLRSITAWRSSLIDYRSDSDAIAPDLRRTRQGEDQHQFSQEVLASGREGVLGWVAGAYYFREHIAVDAQLDRVGVDRTAIRPLVRTRAAALHASATIALDRHVSFSSGVRYSDESKRFVQDAQVSALPGGAVRPGDPIRYTRTARYHGWSPRLGIEYRPVAGVLAYSTLTRGFKSGGFNFASEDPGQGFAPERLWSLEAGVKARLARDALDLRAAAFGYDFRDMQVQSALSPGVSITSNAAVARITGIEAEADLRAAGWLRFGAKLATLDARYRRYPDAPVLGGALDAAGKRLNFAPAFTVSAFVQAQAGRLSARVEASYRSRQYFTPANQSPSDQAGYALADAWIAYALPDRRLRLSGFVRNLGDAAYVTSTAGYGAGITARVGPPRRLGLQLEASL